MGHANLCSPVTSIPPDGRSSRVQGEKDREREEERERMGMFAESLLNWLTVRPDFRTILERRIGGMEKGGILDSYGEEDIIIP